MDFVQPVLLVGIGGAGSKMANDAASLIGADVFAISHDSNDLTPIMTSKFTQNPMSTHPHISLGQRLKSQCTGFATSLQTITLL